MSPPRAPHPCTPGSNLERPRIWCGSAPSRHCQLERELRAASYSADDRSSRAPPLRDLDVPRLLAPDTSSGATNRLLCSTSRRALRAADRRRGTRSCLAAGPRRATPSARARSSSRRHRRRPRSSPAGVCTARPLFNLPTANSPLLKASRSRADMKSSNRNTRGRS